MLHGVNVEFSWPLTEFLPHLKSWSWSVFSLKCFPVFFFHIQILDHLLLLFGFYVRYGSRFLFVPIWMSSWPNNIHRKAIHLPFHGSIVLYFGWSHVCGYVLDSVLYFGLFVSLCFHVNCFNFLIDFDMWWCKFFNSVLLFKDSHGCFWPFALLCFLKKHFPSFHKKILTFLLGFCWIYKLV